MIPVIMSGGAGTRLWPLSRGRYPKQFCHLFERTLIEETLDRVKSLGRPYVLTSANLRDLTLQLSSRGLIDSELCIFEPMARNTGPAIALLCHLLMNKGFAKETVAVFPADHMILNTEIFLDAILSASQAVDRFDVVTLGIRPHFPATGYGYIECQNSKQDVTDVVRFCEKPNLKIAEEFIKHGGFLWNAGVFVFRLENLVKKLRTLAPDLWRAISCIRSDLSNAQEIYENLKAISFDYAIMEKLDNQGCAPCDVQWSDLGSWDNIADFSETGQNARLSNHAETVQTNSSGNFVFSQEKKTASFIGCENLIVVDTKDALLICKKGQSQSVKDIVSILENEALYREHNFDHRPWGSYSVLVDDPDYKAKTIKVYPGQQLSYQSHEKRSENWIVVKGLAEVVLDEEVRQLKSGESVFIPKGAKHRLRNPGQEDLIIVEVQTGSYFGEDDIKRYHDDYGR